MEEKRKQILKELRELPTGNIADAMQMLGIPVSQVKGLVPISQTQPAAAGYAITIRQIRQKPGSKAGNLAKHSAVIDEMAGEGDIVVIDCGGRLDTSTGGSMLAFRAKYKGVEGYVVNGGLRDVREISEMQFPVYFKGPTPLKSAGTLETVGVNEPVEIGGIQICAGDLIVMDDSGVLVIPPELGEAVLEKAKRIHEKEKYWVSLLQEGVTFSEARKICNEKFSK